jgi:predicted RecA/RadA family phage recombinase
MMATFRHGDPLMADYTPSGADVSAGDVVVLGAKTPAVCHRDIVDGELGALAMGGGVYRMTADAAITAGEAVYWDATNEKVTETASGNTLFGIAVTTSAADDDPIDVKHQPDGFAAAA